jgi:peroxiredoxin Q/BCP
MDENRRTPEKGHAMTLPVGTRIPDVEGELPDGSVWRSADTRGKPLVLYFYPKDFTPGCTREACSFRDAREELVGLYGAEVIGVSQDSPATHKKFIAEHRLPFQLVSDAKGAISKAFGAAMLGGLLPISKRVTYVVDADGIVRGVFDHQRQAERHVEEVRECLASIGGRSSAGTAG